MGIEPMITPRTSCMHLKVMLKGVALRCTSVPSGEKVKWSSQTALAIKIFNPGEDFEK